MRKLIYSLIFFLLFFISPSFSFQQNPDVDDIGTGGRDDKSFLKAKNSNFKKGKDALKQAFKLKKKEKFEKANNRSEKALRYFVLAYKENPESIEVLNNLGLTYSMVGDLLMSEIYYQEGLILDPKNKLTNQRLGELYLKTKRIDLAKERLKVLTDCNCKEYSELKEIINKAE